MINSKNSLDIMCEIAQLKGNLQETDYKVMKYTEGALSEEEFANVKIQRAKWRERINELQAELENA